MLPDELYIKIYEYVNRSILESAAKIGKRRNLPKIGKKTNDVVFLIFLIVFVDFEKNGGCHRNQEVELYLYVMFNEWSTTLTYFLIYFCYIITIIIIRLLYYYTIILLFL